MYSNYSKYQGENSYSNKRPWSQKYDTGNPGKSWGRQTDNQDYNTRPPFDREAYYKKKEENEQNIAQILQIVARLSSKVEELTNYIRKDNEQSQDPFQESKNKMLFKLEDHEI
jgi:hypothetical protein